VPALQVRLTPRAATGVPGGVTTGSFTWTVALEAVVKLDDTVAV
jgi:hypothetical protein